VRKYNRCTIVGQSPLYDFPRIHRRLGECPAKELFARQETILRVQIKHDKTLVLPAAKKQPQVVADGIGTGENAVPPHLLGEHTPYKLARDEKLLAPIGPLVR
jgi:hypothetical protein